MKVKGGEKGILQISILLLPSDERGEPSMFHAIIAKLLFCYIRKTKIKIGSSVVI